MYHIMNKSGNISTVHMEKVVKGVEALEHGKSNQSGSAAPRTLKHMFHLRADYQVALELPVDLTEKEAERVAGFVRSLPN